MRKTELGPRLAGEGAAVVSVAEGTGFLLRYNIRPASRAIAAAPPANGRGLSSRTSTMPVSSATGGSGSTGGGGGAFLSSATTTGGCVATGASVVAAGAWDSTTRGASSGGGWILPAGGLATTGASVVVAGFSSSARRWFFISSSFCNSPTFRSREATRDCDSCNAFSAAILSTSGAAARSARATVTRSFAASAAGALSSIFGVIRPLALCAVATSSRAPADAAAVASLRR